VTQRPVVARAAPPAAAPPAAAPAGRIGVVARREAFIAAFALGGILLYLILRWGTSISHAAAQTVLLVVLVVGGAPLVFDLVRKAAAGQFGSDLLAAISIVTAAIQNEYLAGVLVVLMLAGGAALEQFAVGRASSVLQALARRLPSAAHRRLDGHVHDVPVDDLQIGDQVMIFPHEVCPVDGVVLEGSGVMDESYLTGEPFMMPKAPGADVLSGAINGEHALTIRAVRQPTDSRYARIMRVMRDSEQHRPQLRRLGDQLGAWYTPLAVAVALAAWALTGEPRRFLAVLVVATPCPLLIAIPVAIIGAISLSARRSIIIRDPAVLERIDRCRTMILDKTGTLTYGAPALAERTLAPGVDGARVLQLAASLERYSKHPLAQPIVQAAAKERLSLLDVSEVEERPGEGLRGIVDGVEVRIVGRRHAERIVGAPVSETGSGLECVIVVDGAAVATYRFRDVPRGDSHSFVQHLLPRHQLSRILVVSGDRDEEVRYLAGQVGITEVYAAQSPEDKVRITRAETARAPTLFIGDGINDAPALAAATVGLAFGHRNEVTSEAAGAVILDTSLTRVDELLHIARRFRRIALQSAIGGMSLSGIGMVAAAAGLLPPVSGAIAQELIDLAAVLNALRAATPGGALSDYDAGHGARPEA
jgi:heavy metal translocating P-type ATPase